MNDRANDARLLRPLICDRAAPDARRLAGGWAWFDAVEPLRPAGPIVAAAALGRADPAAYRRLTAPRADLLGLSLDRPRVMGVLNVTPDSFSDGGRHLAAEAAIASGLAMLEAGAGMLDVGGESTRPGAEPVAEDEELRRVLPVIEGLRAAAPTALISIDTRKPAVARAAFAAGARLYNDVSALTFAPESLATAAELVERHDGAVCLMHAQGDPRTMQDDPRYGDVLGEVAQFLMTRCNAAIAAGVPAERILIDPGIGFGKTLPHNLTILRGLGALHSLGAPILLGVSRKRFIGALSGETEAARRAPGSIAAGLTGLEQGAQILRAHDVAETVQAVRVWRGLRGVDGPGGSGELERSRR